MRCPNCNTEMIEIKTTTNVTYLCPKCGYGEGYTTTVSYEFPNNTTAPSSKTYFIEEDC